MKVAKLGSDSDDVGRLKAFGAFEQIELNQLSLIQRAISVFLNGGKVDEDVLAG